jgi:hemerythrin-like metal-binding protein
MNDERFVGHPLMDSEHRTLAQWTEEAVERLSRVRPLDECIYAMDVLAHLARSHFAHEDREMRAMVFPAWQSHAFDHQRLMADLARMRSGLLGTAGRRSVRGSRRALVAWISDWMVPHIDGYDRAYAGWLRLRTRVPRHGQPGAVASGDPVEPPGENDRMS